jgi:DNA-directed RNA polymerase specialized sigma24 family protein
MYYVNNENLLKWLASPDMYQTELWMAMRAISCGWARTQKIDEKEDAIMDATIYMARKIKKFDVSKGGGNAFGYFTQIAKYYFFAIHKKNRRQKEKEKKYKNFLQN